MMNSCINNNFTSYFFKHYIIQFPFEQIIQQIQQIKYSNRSFD